MADITLTYKGATIAELSETGTKTIETAGKYCEADIGLEYVKPGGGGRDLTVEAAIIDGTLSGAYENSEVTAVKIAGFQRLNNVTSISLPNCTTLYDSSFSRNSSVTSYYLPKVTSAGSGGQNYIFSYNTSLQAIALPALSNTMKGQLPLAFQNDTALKSVDLGECGGITNQTFVGCSAFDTLILRRPDDLTEIGNVNVFNGTKFASGGAGGTIYIPKALYDHLGDNSSLDYKAATNWSTVDGYGTITWAKIEGSIYETQYADGTPISS